MGSCNYPVLPPSEEPDIQHPADDYGQRSALVMLLLVLLLPLVSHVYKLPAAATARDNTYNKSNANLVHVKRDKNITKIADPVELVSLQDNLNSLQQKESLLRQPTQ